MAIEAGASIPRAHRLGHQRIISALRLLYHDPPDGARKSKAVFTRARPRELCSRALAKGMHPLGFPSFGGYGVLDFSPCLAGTSRRDGRPPTHFFVKKKFSPACGAGSTLHAGGSFFLYEKSGLRESDCLRGREREVCTDLTPPLFRP